MKVRWLWKDIFEMERDNDDGEMCMADEWMNMQEETKMRTKKKGRKLKRTVW